MSNPQTATIRQLRSKLGAATKRSNDDRAFSLKQLATETDLKTQQTALVNMLVTALLALDTWVPREVAYFAQTRLTNELIALYPAVAERLGGRKGTAP